MVSHKRHLSGRTGMLNHAAAKMRSCARSPRFDKKGATSLVAGSGGGRGSLPGTRMKIASFFTTPQPLCRRVRASSFSNKHFPRFSQSPSSTKKSLLALVSSSQHCCLSQLTLKRPKALQPCPPRPGPPPTPKSPPGDSLEQLWTKGEQLAFSRMTLLF